MADVVVVGAGPAGLSAGIRLVAAGVDVTVLEAIDEPGGNVRTMERDGFRMERGPHTFMASAQGVFELASECSADGMLAAANESSQRRFIARSGRLHEVFTGPVGFVRSDLLSARGKLDLLTEPLRTRRGDVTDSAARFFDRRFGPEAARVLAGAFVSGVYAGDPEALSAPAAFPLFWGFEEKHGGMIRGGIMHMLAKRAERRRLGMAALPRRRGLFTTTGGLGTLTRAAADVLGDRLVLSSPVTAVAREGSGWALETAGGQVRANRVIIATPPARAAAMLEELDPALADELAGITLAPVALVHMGFTSRCGRIPDGFGFLVPRGEGIRTLGVLFVSRMFDDRTPGRGDLLSGFVGGMLDCEALALTDGKLVDVVAGDLGKLTGHDRAPDTVEVLRYSAAIPQLSLGHMGRMKRIEKALAAHVGLGLAGNYLGGVGMKDAVASGFEAGRRIVRERR